jgi:hypothetical protein
MMLANMTEIAPVIAKSIIIAVSDAVGACDLLLGGAILVMI